MTKPREGSLYGKCQEYLRDEVLPYDGDECLVWPFSRDQDGYGKLRFLGRVAKAHRVVCILTNGRPPTRQHQAAHACGNGHLGCVTPDHISWKTPAENKSDELQHGTRNIGERNGSSRLTEADVRLIRQLSEENSQSAVARQFGLSSGHVNGIINRRIWRHVD